MKVHEIIKLLERDGWYLVRAKGSHRQFQHDSKQGTITVPGKYSSDAPKGTAKKSSSRQGSSKRRRIEAMKYVAVLERAPTNYGGFVPDVPGATGIADTREATLRSLAEGLALAIQDLTERGLPIPPPSDRADLNIDEHEPEESYEIVTVSPAPMNPVSMEIERVMDTAGITQAELARRMGVSRSVASRIIDPFYFGHSVKTLRRVADALGFELEVTFAAAT